uniref:Butyrophilin-like protein 10 n=1 Tax=Lepisosteus oculatus TaxID=7918 RepID=W5M9L4_LEPOC|nr:PREDICTED: butyrophilin-like protein 10 [Lepisosteus oculatus]
MFPRMEIIFSYLVLLHIAMCNIHEETVTGIIGRPVIIPCVYKTEKPIDLKEMRVYWQVEKKDKTVHVFNKGQEEMQHVTEEYRNRTSFFLKELRQGNISVQLSPVKPTDDEVYIALTQEKGNMKTLCKIKVRVGGSFSVPALTVKTCTQDEDIKLECTSQGGYPQPSVNWTIHSQGAVLQPEKTETQFTQDPESSLLSVISTVTINRTKANNMTASCSIINEILEENKTSPSKTCDDPRKDTQETPPEDSSHSKIWISLPVILSFIVLGLIGSRKYFSKQNIFQCLRKSNNMNPDEESGLPLNHTSQHLTKTPPNQKQSPPTLIASEEHPWITENTEEERKT